MKKNHIHSLPRLGSEAEHKSLTIYNTNVVTRVRPLSVSRDESSEQLISGDQGDPGTQCSSDQCPVVERAVNTACRHQILVS